MTTVTPICTKHCMTQDYYRFQCIFFFCAHSPTILKTTSLHIHYSILSLATASSGTAVVFCTISLVQNKQLFFSPIPYYSIISQNTLKTSFALYNSFILCNFIVPKNQLFIPSILHAVYIGRYIFRRQLHYQPT